MPPVLHICPSCKTSCEGLAPNKWLTEVLHTDGIEVHQKWHETCFNKDIERRIEESDEGE